MKKNVFLILFFSFLLVPSIVDYSAAQQQEVQVLYCTGKYAKRYHKYKCKGLESCEKDIKKIKISEAKKHNLTPCKICYKIR